LFSVLGSRIGEATAIAALGCFLPGLCLMGFFGFNRETGDAVRRTLVVLDSIARVVG
jgi:hypothetical protein